jgi:hypothetical protein
MHFHHESPITPSYHWRVGDRCVHWLLGAGTVTDTTPWLGGIGVRFDSWPTVEVVSPNAIEHLSSPSARNSAEPGAIAPGRRRGAHPP